MVRTTILQDWQKFMISAIAVGIISVLFNIFLFEDTSSVLVWVEFLEKIFAFTILGVFFSFTNPEFLKLDNLTKIIGFSLAVSLFIGFTEFLTGARNTDTLVVVIIGRFLFSLAGISIVRVFYR